MANKKASKKDIRQSAKRYIANKSRRTFIKTCVKAVESAITTGAKEGAMASLKLFEKNGMKAVSKGLFHKKTISRKISRFYSRIKALAS